MVASPFSRCHCSGPREVGAAPASVVLDLGVHPTQPQLAEGFAAHTQSSAGLCCRDPDPVTSGCDWRRLVLHQASSLVVEVRDHTSCRSMSWRWASGCAMLATDRLPSAEAPLLMADSKPLELDQLRLENSRLIALLEAHGIAWRSTEQPRSEPTPDSAQPAASAPGSAQQKVALFRRLFRGRHDIYALRWESRTSGRSGYAPACANEWKPGICEKPRVACRDCSHRELLPVTDEAIYGHLAGEHTLGLYPLLENDTCHRLAVDFDEQDWREDARAFLRSCLELAVPAALEISRSGEGAHVWVFFEEAVPAREARQLGASLISHTCAASRQLQLSSYDRLFPNQDTMPKGGFGNLIALPLQKEARQRGCSVFVDNDLKPYPDQWPIWQPCRGCRWRGCRP